MSAALRRYLLAIVLVGVGPGLVAAVPDCSECHDVPFDAFAKSVHGFLECVDCHETAASVPHEESDGEVDCGACHDEVVSEYTSSIHGASRAQIPEAPGCPSCHGEIHTLRATSDPASPVHPLHLAETCGSCHSDPEMVAKYRIPVVQPLEAYQASVHARALDEGRGGATCNNCHGSHGIFPAGDIRSTVLHRRVLETCGQCHGEITETYRVSVHGAAAEHGVREAPTCTDCHGEHRILSPHEPGSPVFPTNIPLQTCGRCHGDLRLSDKYGIPANTVPAYQSSYHGLAARAGVQTVANCASCHGVHDIQPSSDERSHVHPANLARTCGKCHPGAGSRFSLGPVHVLASDEKFAAVYWVRRLYIPLIWVTIAAMLLHNLMDLFRKRSAAPPARAVGPRRERMNLGFRIAHGVTIISFITLIYSGFALTYPESWWARPLLRWENGIDVRAGLHRVAAGLLLGALAFHLVHIVVSRRARACIASMLPRWEDVSEFRGRLSYYLGRRPAPPAVADVGYVEKVEYLAFLWGMVVMATTGFVLWFENPALRLLPKWAIDVATAIHFYEAVLASLAIAVWHLYWVIFDPVIYPMDTTWWTGRSPAGRAAERSTPPAKVSDRSRERQKPD